MSADLIIPIHIHKDEASIRVPISIGQTADLSRDCSRRYDIKIPFSEFVSRCKGSNDRRKDEA